MAVQNPQISEIISDVLFQLTNKRTGTGDLSTSIQYAIDRAQTAILSVADDAGFRETATFQVTSGDNAVTLADDFSRMIEPGVHRNDDPQHTLHFYENQNLLRYELQRFGETGEPCAYTLRGRDPSSGQQEVEVYPTPDATYTYKYHYFARPTSIATVGTSTRIDPRFPQEAVRGLFYGAVLDFPNYTDSQTKASFLELFEEAKTSFRRHLRKVTGYIHQNDRFSVTRGGVDNTWHRSVTGTVHH